MLTPISAQAPTSTKQSRFANLKSRASSSMTGRSSQCSHRVPTLGSHNTTRKARCWLGEHIWHPMVQWFGRDLVSVQTDRTIALLRWVGMGVRCVDGLGRETVMGGAMIADAHYNIGWWVLHFLGSIQCEHTRWRDWPLVVILWTRAGKGGMCFGLSRLQLWSRADVVGD